MFLFTNGQKAAPAGSATFRAFYFIALFLLTLSAAQARSTFQALSFAPLPTQPAPLRTGIQESAETTPLEQGKPVERQLSGGQAQAYRLKLEAGQFLRAIVEQRGIDVLVKLFGPDGKQLLEVDSPNGTEGPEPISFIADLPGDYRIEVHSLDQKAASGKYDISVLELRAATDDDRKLAVAEKASAQAEELRAQGTLESLRKAIGKFEEAAPLFRALGRAAGEASALNGTGEIYYGFGEKQKALDYFNQSLALRRAIKDQSGEAIVLNNLGVTYQSLGQMQKAIELFNQSLTLHRATRNRYQEAMTLNNIGHLYDVLGEKQKALDYYNQALPIRRDIGDSQGEAYTVNNMAIVYLALGEYQKALDYFNQALPRWRAAGNRGGEGTTLNNIGYTYDRLGDKKAALDFYNQGLQLRRSVGDRSGEAETLNNIGLLYDSMNERQKALDYYNQALPIQRAVNNPYAEGTTLSNIGLIYSATGEYQKALDYFNQSLPIRRRIGDRSGEGHTLNNIALVYFNQRETEKAADFFSQALALSHAVSDRQTEAKILYNLAGLEGSRNKLDEARARIEAALSIVESVRTNIGSQQLRASYFASMQDLYMLYIEILMRLHKQRPAAGHDAEALQASERARARILLEMLAEAAADIRQGVEPALLERERVLQKQLNDKAQEQIRILTGTHTTEQAEAVAREIEALTAEYQEVQAQIRARSPRYAALTQPQPLDLRTIQKELLDANTVLLEYSLGKEASYLWAVTRDSIQSYQLPPREEIEANARRVYELITSTRRGLANQPVVEKDAKSNQTQAELAEACARLGQMLLAPVAANLGNKT